MGCISALGIYTVWKNYDLHHGGGFISDFCEGGFFFGGLAIPWFWAKNSDEQQKDECAQAVKEKQLPST